MPRELIEIPLSNLGVVCNADSKDMPDNYVVSSKNLDPMSPIGRIKPIKTYSSTTDGHKTATKAVWLNDSSEVTGLLYTDGTDLKLTGTFYGTQAASTVKTTCNPSSMELFNKAVHLGLGNATPKWVGYIENKQFGSAASTSIQIQDAECTIGESYQSLSKVSTDGTYLYGVTDGGKHIYKFDLATETLVKESTFLLDYTISLCVDGTYIWLLHKRGSTYYVAKFTNELEFILDAPISGTDNNSNTIPPSGSTLSDIEKTNGALWISPYNPTNPCHYVWKFTRPSTNSTITLTDMHPFILAGGSNGMWDTTDALISYARKPLVQFSNTAMCFACACTGTLYDDSSYPQQVYGGLIKIEEAYSPSGTTYFDGVDLEFYNITTSEMPDYKDLQISLSYGVSNRRLYKYNKNGSTITSYVIPAFGVYKSVPNMTIESTNGVTLTAQDVYILPINTTGTSITVHLFKQQNSDWYKKINSSTGSWGSETAVFKSKIDITFKDTVTDSSGLLSTKAYFYAINYVFDDIQQSPLSSIFRCNLKTVKQKEVTIKLKDTTAGVFNKKRVTAVNLYRAENDADAPVKETLMRFVASFDIRESFPLIDNDYYQIVFIDDGQTGPTFEAMAEYSELVDSTIIKHTYSTQLGGYRYIAKCYKEELPDAEHIIFRSKLYSFDTFDWTTDLLRCFYVPKAIKGFNNRLFVFFENLIWRVNPDLQPEEDYQGIGIFDNLEPLVTDEGMYWMDKNGIYFHNGSTITDISVPIKTSYSSSYKSYTDTIAAGTQRCMAYSPEKKCVLFSSLNSGTGNIWVWHTESKQWFFWEYGTVTSFYMFNGYKGEVFISTTGNFRQLFNGSNYESAEFVTKKYDAGTSKQKKKWYKVKSRTSGTVSTTYAYDDSTSFSSFTESLNNLSAYNLQLKFSMTGDSYIDSAEIILRQMRGYR